MAIGNIKRLAGPFTGAGTKTLPFGFKIFAATDVFVALAESDGVASNNLTINTDYTVSMNADQETTPGGTVTLVNPLTEGQVVSVGTNVPYTQTTELTNYSRFPPEIINTALDRIVVQIQQLVEQLGRAVLTDATSSTTPQDLLENLFAARKDAVEACQKAQAAAATSEDYANRVLAFKDAIEAVSGYLVEISMVCEALESVKTTAADIAAVRTVSENISKVTALLEKIAYVKAAADEISSVVTVASNIQDVNLVSRYREQVNTVAGKVSDVSTVSEKISDVSTVAKVATAVTTVVAHLAAVDTTAENIDSVKTVAADIANVVAAGQHVANIDLVAADLTNIDALVAYLADIRTVADKRDEILATPAKVDARRDAALDAISSAQTSAVSTISSTAAVETKSAQSAINATATQAKTDIQKQVDEATAQAKTATTQATTATEKATAAAQSAEFAAASKTASETAQTKAETAAQTATAQATIATEKAQSISDSASTLETLENDSVRFTAQDKTDKEKYIARKNIAASSQSEVDALKKQIVNLQAQNEGKTFTYETDATEAYSKDVPEGAYPYAAVKSFGGRTIVWNQLYQKRSDTTSGNVSFVFSENSVTVKNIGEVGGYASCVLNTNEVFSGHRYLFVIGNKSDQYGSTSKWQVYLAYTLASGNSNLYHLGSGVGYAIVTAPGTGKCECVFSVYEGFSETVELSMGIYDLTSMFGAGCEPTAEEFFKMFPDDYYEYSEKELKSAPISNLNVRGRNILPSFSLDSSSKGGVSVTKYDDGSILLNGTSSTSFELVGEAPASAQDYAGKVLTMSSGNPLPAGTWLSWGDGLPMLPGNGSATSISRTGAVGIRGNVLFLYVNSGVTFNNLRIYPMMVVGNEEKEYKPYTLKTREVPQAVLDLEGYGWSAGTVKNWVDWEKKEYHREVGSADLGTLGWKKQSRYFFCILSDGAYTDSTKQAGFILPKYEKSSAHYTTGDNTYAFGTGYEGFGKCYLEIQDSSYDTAASFKESLKGVICHYELAEPEIIDISDILPDDNLFEVEEGGTVIFENSEGSSFRFPVPSEVVYQKKVTTNE